MPIYEYYCPYNNKIYQFFAKTLAQGQTLPKCPDNPAYRMRKIVSAFAVRPKGAGKKDGAGEDSPKDAGPGGGDDPRMDAAMAEMEREFSSVDENDPKAMGRMMRRMTELTGEKMDGEMEEVVRKLEEGADPDSLEDQLGGGEEGPDDPYGEGPGGPPEPTDPREPRQKFRSRSRPPVRDPNLYDYE
jgi:predicted nucleic acid-binding Zn ribbon protein